MSSNFRKIDGKWNEAVKTENIDILRNVEATDLISPSMLQVCNKDVETKISEAQKDLFASLWLFVALNIFY